MAPANPHTAANPFGCHLDPNPEPVVDDPLPTYALLLDEELIVVVEGVRFNVPRDALSQISTLI